MPTVKFPYTKAGKKLAAKARRQIKKLKRKKRRNKRRRKY